MPEREAQTETQSAAAAAAAETYACAAAAALYACAAAASPGPIGAGRPLLPTLCSVSEPRAAAAAAVALVVAVLVVVFPHAESETVDGEVRTAGSVLEQREQQQLLQQFQVLLLEAETRELPGRAWEEAQALAAGIHPEKDPAGTVGANPTLANGLRHSAAAAVYARQQLVAAAQLPLQELLLPPWMLLLLLLLRCHLMPPASHLSPALPKAARSTDP